MKHCHKAHITYLAYRCLSMVFTKISTRKLKKTMAFGLLLLAGALTTPVSAQTVVNICDRTPEVETAILAAISPTPACDAVTPAQLAAITILSLSSMNIGTLASGDFDGLSSLIILELNGNSLTTLPANIFSDLSALTLLDLSSNMLTTLPANAFSGLSALTRLDLSFNPLLTTLPAGAFAGLSMLASLILNGNSLSTLPSGAFAGLSALTTLNLRDNSLSALPDDVFSSLTALTSLFLSRNQLTALPAGLFNGLGSLASLRLEANPITTPLPANIFGPLPGTAVIRIDLSPIGDLADEVVLGDGDTRSIDLSGLFISRDATGMPRTLTYTILPSAPSVATATESSGTLTITANGIGTTMISVTADDDLGVNAADNIERNIAVRVEGVMNICDRSDAVEAVILAAIPASPACDAVTMTQLAAITGLSLDGGRTGTLSLSSDDFTGLSGLTSLGIFFYTLSALPADVFLGLTNLEILSLANNMLTTLPAGLFTGLDSLATLRLQGNAFAVATPLPADLFDPLPSDALIHIDLSPIGELPDIALTIGTTTTINIANAFISRDRPGNDRDLSFTVTPGAGASVMSATESGGVLTITASDTTLGMTDVSIAANDGVGTRTRTVAVTVTDVTVNICDRTDAVETAILADSATGSDCTMVTAGELAAITSLDLSSITSLQAGDFAGLTGITTLDLSFNSLTTLPSGVFAGLSMLTTLNLNNNTLSALEADVFSDLSALTTLNLSGNSSLNTLPADVF